VFAGSDAPGAGQGVDGMDEDKETIPTPNNMANKVAAEDEF